MTGSSDEVEPLEVDQEVEDVGDGARLLALVLTLGLGGS